MYGKNRSNEDFCVFEIEANPSHWERLDSVSTAYKNVGWRYQIVKAAAFDKPGTMTFYHQGTDRRRSEFGFSIKSMGNTDNEHFSKVEVPTLRLADWIQTELLERQIPATPPSGTTYEKPIFGMKFDIEASELVVLPDMLMTGVMCKIDFMFGEYHTFLVPMEFENPNVTVKNEGQVRFLRNAMKGILGTARNCQTSFIIMDDEEYLHDGKPLPGDQQ
ncbi:unnamed protein product [Cylindrotheca closterium]|uniref:Uncharacterized protein n=1 Tax=Cylindrotheca closterium TaxID=2856 RepID=A0AAD2G2D7_9STRA|nr:unnamed protein product [Cylindrotheca closterium]